MTSKVHTESVSDFLALMRENLRASDDISESTPLISSGIVDSFDIVTLFTLFESEYGIVLEPADVSVENFDTPSQMLLLLRKHATQ